MPSQTASSPLGEIACALSDTTGLEDVCKALEDGRLTRDSTAAARAAVASGSSAVESCVRNLLDEWTVTPGLSGASIALAIRAAATSLVAFRHRVAATQVVWTGPNVEGSFLRATRQVVREILRGAQRELLIVGYWLAAHDDGDGIIEEVVASLAEAVQRGVAVVAVLDERVRSDGRDNRQILVSAWPDGIALPRLLTWRLPSNDKHLKLHAKVVVADRRDALVTSANLTSYAMDRNMEMGVRIVGPPAADIARHFDLLAEAGKLEPYQDEQAVA